MNRINSQTRKIAAVAAASALSVSQAFAQVTDPFDTVLTTVTGKVESYGGSLLVLAGVGVVLMIGVKYIKKLRGAA